MSRDRVSGDRVSGDTVSRDRVDHIGMDLADMPERNGAGTVGRRRSIGTAIDGRGKVNKRDHNYSWRDRTIGKSNEAPSYGNLKSTRTSLTT